MENAMLNRDFEKPEIKSKTREIKCTNQDCKYKNKNKLKEHICPLCGWIANGS